MAAVMASKPPVTQGKSKKPSAPFIQTSMNGVKPTQPSSSPSSATKRLPGQNQTPASNNNGAINGSISARSSRRPQRLTTRNITTDNANAERRAVRKYPEPYVSNEGHILKKWKSKPPSLIVHLHPTHFRFDQQDGSFSYQSEMRIFIEHLKKKTVPHDMLEEFRKSDVQFYDGWLIVRVVDHKSVVRTANSPNAASEDEKVNSIHKHTPYITPSPYAPYPSRDQAGSTRSPPVKQEPGVPGSSLGNGETSSANGDTIEVAKRPAKPQPRVFTVALRPTNLSRHMDLVLDSMMPDPKVLNRRQSQAYVNGRAPGSSNMAAPPTPSSTLPPTPSTEKGPPFKRQKLKIDPKDLLEYEARIVNATAPPLYLDAADSFEEVQSLLLMMKDPLHDYEPPSPKSRKRTVAELAADDAYAKGQERFMQIMDERFGATAAAGNAGLDGQAANGLFQPRFEKFIALENIKKAAAERERAERAEKAQEDENKRFREEELRRAEALRQQQQAMATRQQAEATRRAQVELKQQMVQLQQQHRQAQQQQNHQSGPPNGVPQNMRAGQIGQQSSPIIRQGSPLAKSSPMITNTAQMGHGIPMSATGSNSGAAGSPPRPGSALQHAHPGNPMVRGPSNQGTSRNGTPQIPNATPGVRHSTPVMRQGTPSQRMTQASPHANMIAHTPQMSQAGIAMTGQMQNGIPPNAQLAQIHARNQMLQHQAAMAQQNANGQPMSAQQQMLNMQAQRAAQNDQQAAMQFQQQQQQQQHQQQLQMQQMAGNMQQHPGQSPALQAAQQQIAYKAKLAEQMQNQMRNMQNGQAQHQGSPIPQQPTPQQQHAAQQLQQQRMMQAAAQVQQQQGGQAPNGVPHPQQQQSQRPGQSPAQQMATSYYKKLLAQIAQQKYGGNMQALTQDDHQLAQNNAQNMVRTQIQRNQAQMQAAQMRQNAQQNQGQGQAQGQNPNMAAMMAQQQHRQAMAAQQMANGGQQGGDPNMMAMLQAQARAQVQAQAQAQMQQMQQMQAQAQGHGIMNPQAQAEALASKQAYQQQLQHMLQQNQGQGGGQGR